MKYLTAFEIWKKKIRSILLHSNFREIFRTIADLLKVRELLRSLVVPSKFWEIFTQNTERNVTEDLKIRFKALTICSSQTDYHQSGRSLSAF
jgi:hypothetical protein